MQPATVNQVYKDLVTKVDNQMAALSKKVQDQKNAEEQERLRKIQEEMEREKKRKQEEERLLKEEEENRRKKAEIEARRKIEEEERRKQEEEDRKAAELLHAQQEKDARDERRYHQQLEQERQDHELALRLAQESNGQLEESPPMIRKYDFFLYIPVVCSIKQTSNILCCIYCILWWQLNINASCFHDSAGEWTRPDSLSS